MMKSLNVHRVKVGGLNSTTIKASGGLICVKHSLLLLTVYQMHMLLQPPFYFYIGLTIAEVV